MRLLFVSHSFPPLDRPLANVGGMQRVATELHAALGQHAAVELSSLVLRSTWRWTHIKTPFFLARTWRRIRRDVEAGTIDAVLFSSMVTASMALPLRRVLDRHGVAAAAIAHGRDVTLPFTPYQYLVPKVFDALDAVFPVSRATGRACRERGLPERKMAVIPNGVDLSRFAPPPAKRRPPRLDLKGALDASEHPLPEEAFLLCSVGRQVERKGFAWFVDRVMPLLPPDVHYWLAGDGPEQEAIEEAVAARGLQRRVRLLGRIPETDLEKLYRGADLFVMPNIPIEGDMEGFGVVMLEAGQCGLPTVAARLEGIQDVITNGANGRLVPPLTPEAFAEAVHRYRDDRAALRAASDRAARYVADTFAWPAVAQRYVRALQALTRPTLTLEAVRPELVLHGDGSPLPAEPVLETAE